MSNGFLNRNTVNVWEGMMTNLYWQGWTSYYEYSMSMGMRMQMFNVQSKTKRKTVQRL